MNQNLFKEYEGVFAPTHEDAGGPTASVGQKKERVFGYSPFALQDAIGEKNVKKAWIEYEKLRLAGIEADELIHKIISKAMQMSAITNGSNAEDLGIKDYPYSKSKKDARNWKGDDLKNFYAGLLEIYHRSRMGGEELDLAIEKILLSI